MAELRHTLRVRYSDCDPQGVVFNAIYLTYFDIAVTELWREAFGGYQRAVERYGADVVVAEATVRYLAPIRFDEEIELVLTIARLGNTSMISSIAIEHGGEPAAGGEIRHVYVTPGGHEKTVIPDGVRAALQPYLIGED